MKSHILEAYTRVFENAKIEGVALIPTISRNNNLYTKKELENFDGQRVPLNWEHDSNKVIGHATFHFDPETFTVFYEGVIEDPASASLAKNRTLYTSIEANPTMQREVCNTPGDCFNMPSGLRPIALALTETPGVVQTTVEIVESVLKECHNHTTIDKGTAKKYIEAEELEEQVLKVLNSVEYCQECKKFEKKTTES